MTAGNGGKKPGQQGQREAVEGLHPRRGTVELGISDIAPKPTKTATSQPALQKLPAATRTSTGQQAVTVPKSSTASTQPVLTPIGANMTPPSAHNEVTVAGAPAFKMPAGLTRTQKSMEGSAFMDSSKDQKRKQVMGTDPGAPRLLDDEPDAPLQKFDGQTAPEALTRRDVWKAIIAPVQSKEGRRSRKVLEQVILQFAVGTNPRYEPDAPDKPRGHIFVWDVSRAMGCEIPHFAGPKELTLHQTTDWVRHEGPMRGWTRANGDDAFDAVMRGQMVVVVPKEPRAKGIGVVQPPKPKSNDLILAGAFMNRGMNLSPNDLLGTSFIEFFVHA